MNCQNCHQDIEAGAAFCGNCGQPIQLAAASTKTVAEIAQILRNQSDIEHAHHGRLAIAGHGKLMASMPSYAFTKPSQHIGETKALLSLLFGVIAIVAALFIPLVGLGLGGTGIIMGTISHSSHWRKLSTIGLVISILAVLFSIGAWVYNIKHNPKISHEAVSNSAAVHSANVSTPCYSAGFVDKFNVKNNSGSCDAIAFNGPTMDESTDAYKVYANQAQIMNAKEFMNIAKQALEKDVKDSLPGFTISNQKVTQFAGSPAYYVKAVNKAQGVTVIEEAVFHEVSSGQNIFVLVHAANGSPDMNTLESQWQWK
ncbi:MAG: zinc ribbon domain-containing protein [Patescibacteria group bacterium]